MFVCKDSYLDEKEEHPAGWSSTFNTTRLQQGSSCLLGSATNFRRGSATISGGALRMKWVDNEMNMLWISRRAGNPKSWKWLILRLRFILSLSKDTEKNHLRPCQALQKELTNLLHVQPEAWRASKQDEGKVIIIWSWASYKSSMHQRERTIRMSPTFDVPSGSALRGQRGCFCSG